MRARVRNNFFARVFYEKRLRIAQRIRGPCQMSGRQEWYFTSPLLLLLRTHKDEDALAKGERGREEKNTR